MSKGLQWVIGICLVLAIGVLIFSVVAPFFLPRVAVTMPGNMPGQYYWRGFGFGGPGHMFGGRGMMGGFGFPFLRAGFLIGPLLIIGLLVLGAVWLTRRRSAPVPTPTPAAPAPAATTPCAHCGQPLEAGWKACPYCGEKV